MNLAGLAGRAQDVVAIGGELVFRCPRHAEQCAGARENGGRLELWCDRGCTGDELSGLLGIPAGGAAPVTTDSEAEGRESAEIGSDASKTPVRENGAPDEWLPDIANRDAQGATAGDSSASPPEHAAVVQELKNAAADPQPMADVRGGNAGSTPAGSSEPPYITYQEMRIAEWQGALTDTARALINADPATYRNRENLELALADAANHAAEMKKPTLMWPIAPQNDLEGALAAVALKVLGNGNGKAPAVKQAVSIPWENYALAIEANDAYLAREPVIHKLCYSSAVSMITGGKHAGKSTLARWMAICVAKGLSFLKREVIQGPVFYIASEDEAMPARQELIRLGWNIDDPLRFFSSANMPTDDPLKFLQALAGDIKNHRVSLVVLDMLFDFVRIADEMSYAGTREAVGHIQDVASQTGAHLTVIHHAPKNAAIGDAAVAALGSQGLAARVSPIILVRRFGPGVHSIVSTSVRDPRGEAITESRLLRHEDGSVTLGGVWKTYMLAEAYSERVLEFIAQEEGAEVTASDVADGLSMAYEVARSCLSSLWKAGAIEREGAGKKGKPFRYREKTEKTPHSPYREGSLDTETAEEQGRFGYKE